MALYLTLLTLTPATHLPFDYYAHFLFLCSTLTSTYFTFVLRESHLPFVFIPSNVLSPKYYLNDLIILPLPPWLFPGFTLSHFLLPLPHPLLLSLNHLSSKFPIGGISPIQRYLDHETRKRVAVGGGEPDHSTLERQGGGQVRDRE